MSALPVSKQVIIDVFLFMLLCVPLFALFILGKPGATGFWCNDQSLSYPYKPDSVSQPLLLSLGFGAPFVVIFATELCRAIMKSKQPGRFKREMRSCAKAYGVFLFGFGAVCLFTETLKYSVGRLRPHFFDVCKPDLSKANCSTDTHVFIQEYECTNTNVDHKILKDSQLSFPSGHASVSVYSALFTVFYLQMRMEVNFSYLLRPMLQMTLMVGATLCCVTRIVDYKHFLSDVLVGCVLGVALAWLSFYKMAFQVIPTVDKETRKAFARAVSIESEPQTPTPLLRPERLVLNQKQPQLNGQLKKWILSSFEA